MDGVKNELITLMINSISTTSKSHGHAAKVIETRSTELNTAAQKVQESLKELLKVAETAVKQKEIQEKLNTAAGKVQTALEHLVEAANKGASKHR